MSGSARLLQQFAAEDQARSGEGSQDTNHTPIASQRYARQKSANVAIGLRVAMRDAITPTKNHSTTEMAMPSGYSDVLANGTPMASSPGAAATPRISPVHPLARPSNNAEYGHRHQTHRGGGDQGEKGTQPANPRPVPQWAFVDGFGHG